MLVDQNKIKILTDSLNKYGISNKYLQAGILGVIYKETNFKPQAENLNYTAKRIVQVWKKIPLEIAYTLANNPEKLGNYVYGNKYGNSATEGYKYRGRGLNQLTFKDNYKYFGNLIGQDLVKNPELLNNFNTASDVVAVFFADTIKQGIKRGKFEKFNISKLEDINNLEKGLKVSIQANAGLNTNFENNIVQEGYNKAKSIIQDLYSKIDAKKSIAGAGIIAILIGAYFFFRNKK
jgi:putative chitinase